ncbi:MAG: methyltransferase [Deltaproteobacteria bacterium]|nr:MAG: methyltransferase [Deltaproteobacteria bacterium]
MEALLAKDYPTAKDALVAALASPHRRPGHAERDRYRHPVEVMEFFGLRKDMTVVEVGAGAGWWTELLAVVLHRDGKLVLPSYAEDDPDPTRAYFGLRDRLLLESAPVLYGRVERFIQPSGETSFGPPQSADMVLVVRMLHNWHRFGTFDADAKAAFEVLRPGGILAVVQHRAPEGGDPDEWAEKGYLPEAYVIDALGRAGFELVAKSEVNANPKDTKDHPEGVWTLPPTLALGDVDREKYLAIGESDRMTLKFRRPEG